MKQTYCDACGRLTGATGYTAKLNSSNDPFDLCTPCHFRLSSVFADRSWKPGTANETPEAQDPTRDAKNDGTLTIIRGLAEGRYRSLTDFQWAMDEILLLCGTANEPDRSQHVHKWEKPTPDVWAHMPMGFSITGEVCACGAMRDYGGPALGWRMLNPGTANEQDRSQNAPPEVKEHKFQPANVDPLVCSLCGRRESFHFGTANETDRSQEPTRDAKLPWKVVQDGLGTWNVWEVERGGVTLAPKSIALSLTEENARQIVSDHNRGEAKFISNETMALRKILDMATELLQGPVYSDTKALMRICDEAEKALGLRDREAKS